MAELQARYDNLDTSAQSLWQYPLPDGKDISIGRRSQQDLDVPEWNRSDWVVEDPRISGRHVTITWDGQALRVRRRLEPADRPAINPVFYRGKTNDDFQMQLGETFTIGSTTFTLQLKQETKSGETSEPGGEMARTIGRDELRRTSFIDARTPLTALADLPEIIRTTREDAQLEDRFLDVVLKGLPLAEFAGFVQIDPRGGADARAAVTRSKQRGLTDEAFRVSNRLVRHAARDVVESVLYIWDKKNDAGSKYSMTMTPGTDWAICTPLDERPAQNRAIYVAGRLGRNILNEDQLKRDSEFVDFQKFINLASELFCTMRDTRRMEKQNTLLRQYLPRSLVKIMELQPNLEEKLRPRISDVTALFCDLRGSSQYAQDNTDMLSAWANMSTAIDIMTNSIHVNQGVIGGLQGDAAVGFWGWPDSHEQQVDYAIAAALGIRKDFDRSGNRLSNQKAFTCGIGMAHGPAVVGKLGTFHQFKLDAYGTVMNLAARLESLTKLFGVHILVDEAIALRLIKVDPDRMRGRVRFMGKVRPAGMTIRVPIYELMPPVHEADPEDSGINYNMWDVGMRAFVDGKWDIAQKRLNQFVASLTDERAEREKAGKYFIDYITRHNNKPPEKWDGTIEMDAK
jgi:adenylate cyclase